MNNKIADQIFQKLLTTDSPVIIAHKSPDGDSIGSSLALFHFLESYGKKPVICHPDKAADYLNWMPGIEKILTFEENESAVTKIINDSKVIICLDFNSPTRVGKVETLLRNSSAEKLMIDHHLNPDLDFFLHAISEPKVCSTAQLIFEFIASQNHLDKITIDCATCIYTGLVTDTGSFRFSSVSSKTHEVAAHLIKIGLKQNEVHENLFDQTSLDQIKLTSFALLEKLVVLPEFNIAYLSLTLDEQKRFNVSKGDTEGLVNKALGIEGVKMAVFFKEDVEIVKISFRSKGAIPVNEMAQNNFEGGGHLNAAGGKFVGSLNMAVDKLVTEIPNFVNKNKALFK